MDSKLIKIDESSILFFDVESVRKNKELEIDSKEFELYQWKLRNKETNELLPDNEVQEHYRLNAGLKFPYVKIVAITVGYIHNDTMVVKDLEGTEEEMLEEFFKISSSFDYVCGANILQWDIPLCRIRLSTYKPVFNIIPPQFNDSGKKPWNLGNIIDLFDIYKGTHFFNSSLDELCMMYGVDSPKDEIKGSDVSDAYYDGKIDLIKEYCSKDVIAVINLYRVFLGKQQLTNVEVRNTKKEKINPLKKLYQGNELILIEDELLEHFKSKKKPTKKEKEHIREILRGVYIKTDFINGDQDNKKTKEIKEREIEEFLEKL